MNVDGRDAAVAVVAVVGAYVLLTLAMPRLRLPMRDKQVPLEWRSRMGPLAAAIVYSAILGAGVFTRINSVGIYLIPVAAVLAPSWTLALAPALVYGFARAASVVAPSVALADRYYQDVDGVMRWLTHQRRVWTAVQAVAVAATAVAATVVTLTSFGG